MRMAEFIRKFGFRRWYERTLLESHAYLVTCFLGMIAAFAGLELIAVRSSAAHSLLGLTASAIGVVLVVFGLRRYAGLMTLAEQMSDRAVCPQCQAYAAFQVMAIGAAADDVTTHAWLEVKCRQCGNEWKM